MQLVSRGRRFLLAGVCTSRDKARSRADRQLTIAGEKKANNSPLEIANRYVTSVVYLRHRIVAGTICLHYKMVNRNHRDTWRYEDARVGVNYCVKSATCNISGSVRHRDAGI